MFGGPVFAATTNASSCAIDAVQSAVAAASDGDTINVPAGTCAWNSTFTLAKGVKIEGAGIGKTIIAGARFTVTTDKAWSVGGFTTSGTAGFNVTGISKLGRIHHIRFDTVTGFAQNRTIWSSGIGAAGVIDHNQFYRPRSIQIHVRESDGGNNSWNRPLDLGGPDAWYVEDNTFEQLLSEYNVSTPLDDCDGGGRLVIRHNNIKLSYTEMHDAIIGGLRSCRKWETYANDFYPDSNANWGQIAIRGGNGVVFDNTFYSYSSAVPGEILLALYRTYQTGGSPWGSMCSSNSQKACFGTGSSLTSCSSDSQCGGKVGSCQEIDGRGSPAGYPCRDQVGTDVGTPQSVVPALFWNNKYAASVASYGGRVIVPDIHSGSGYIVSGRDYCAGATKPASCAGKAVHYQPYTYPHPLAGGTTPPPPPPTCTTPKPANETRTTSCPAGTVGSFVQTRTYSADAYPTCWTPGPWNPADPQPGVCVPDSTPVPVATITRGTWDLYRGSTVVAGYSSEQNCITAATNLAVTQIYTCRTRTTVNVTLQ